MPTVARLFCNHCYTEPFLLSAFIAAERVKQLLKMPLSKEKMHKYPTLFTVPVFCFYLFPVLRMIKYTQDIVFIKKFILLNIKTF